MFSLFFAAKAEQHFISGPDYSGVSSFSDSVVYVENGVATCEVTPAAADPRNK